MCSGRLLAYGGLRGVAFGFTCGPVALFMFIMVFAARGRGTFEFLRDRGVAPGHSLLVVLVVLMPIEAEDSAEWLSPAFSLTFFLIRNLA